ncbi:MAG: arsenate reductase ArsC, partial [Pseudomonadota bacterium]
PHALRQLQERRIPVEGLHSKSWEDFSHPRALCMHFVFSVCDSVSWHACPIWSGIPMAAHWGLPDPTAATGGQLAVEQAFANMYKVLYQRISLLIKVDVGINLPALQLRLDEIGRAGGF